MQVAEATDFKFASALLSNSTMHEHDSLMTAVIMLYVTMTAPCLTPQHLPLPPQPGLPAPHGADAGCTAWVRA